MVFVITGNKFGVNIGKFCEVIIYYVGYIGGMGRTCGKKTFGYETFNDSKLLVRI